MSETPAKQFSRCKVGDIVYYEGTHVFVTKLDSEQMIVWANSMIVNAIEVNLKDREKLTYPIPQPIPNDIIEKRNTYMYELKNNVNSTTVSVSVSTPTPSTPSIPIVENLLGRRR
jgi:hypothetical protein